MLNVAQDQCKQLAILLCSQPDDPIPGAVRLEWLQKTFPQAHIVHHPEPLPRDQSNPHFWDLWRESIEKHCPGETYDAVFSSESYGQRLAKELGSIHISVDPSRDAFPVSGTDIRNDPLKYWEFIPDIVRPYYKKLLKL